MSETAINFEGTKDAGEECERRLAAHLSSIGAKDVRIVGSSGTKDWDIICSVGTYEVKRDFRSVSTGNHFIEHLYNGQPSGLKVTKADYFVLFVPHCMKIMPTKALKEFMNLHHRAFAYKENAGDDGRASGFIVPSRYVTGSYITGLNEVPLRPPIPYDPQLRRQRLA